MKKLPSNHIITYFDAIFFDNLIFIEIEEKNPSNHNIKQFDRIFRTIFSDYFESKSYNLTDFFYQFMVIKLFHNLYKYWSTKISNMPETLLKLTDGFPTLT